MYRDIDIKNILKIINNFKTTRILVVGDVIVDKFVWGDVSRISPEAPVPVVKIKSENTMLGGSGNVAKNITTLGGKAYLVSVVGKDKEASLFESVAKENKININGILTDSGRPTTVKTRVIAHHQQVVRIDKESDEAMSKNITDKMVKFIRKNMKNIDALLIEDYGKGVITPMLLASIVKTARQYKKIITVDPKEDHFSYYKDITAITPNQSEAYYAAGQKYKNEKDVSKIGKIIIKKLNCEIVLITRGEHGMMLTQKGKKQISIPTVAQDVFDVSGAGDTVISVFTMALISGAQPHEAAFISNCAAGIVVGKVGVATVKEDELVKRIKEVLKK